MQRAPSDSFCCHSHLTTSNIFMKCAVTPLQDTVQSLFPYGYLTTEPPICLKEVVQDVCSIYQSPSPCLPPQTVSLCVCDSSWTLFSKMKKNVCLLLLQKLVTFEREWKEARKGKNSYTEKCSEHVKKTFLSEGLSSYTSNLHKVALHCLIFSRTVSLSIPWHLIAEIKLAFLCLSFICQ